MTKEEAARILNPATTSKALYDIMNDGYCGLNGLEAWRIAFNDACCIAVADLRKQTAREKNDPLTLKELQKMHGEPVYCLRLIDDRHGWGLVDLSASPPAVEGVWHLCLIEKYGRTWLAYRRKPEEGGADR